MMSQKMDHALAESTHAVERYLLEETTMDERAIFEEHLFDCAICAEEVRNGAIFFDNAKAVLKDERDQGWKPWNLFVWFQAPVLVPSFAAMGLLAVVAYQNLVTLPALFQPQVLTTAVLAPLSRESAPEEIKVDRKRPMFNVNLSIDTARVYPSYTCTFVSESGAKVEELNTGPQQFSSFTLSILLPTKKFAPGKYVAIVRPATETGTVVAGTVVGRYTFAVRNGDSN